MSLLAELLRPQLLFPLRSALGFGERGRRGIGTLRFGCLSAMSLNMRLRDEVLMSLYSLHSRRPPHPHPLSLLT